jgi:rhamnose utilization protein RhaD (predicted bifunctional aldolase and dehydrogenase)
MKSLWNEADAACCNSELGLRAYASRLLGGDAELVLHGGGNTSLKRDEQGEHVLYVKGTGSDLARADEHAFTPLQLGDVKKVLQQDHLDNAGMMRALDACLVRRPAPRPSIETLLHAGLPYRCVEHTHADAVLAAMNVERIEAVHADVYGDVAPLVPYHHSGHALARACMAVFEAQRTANTIGLILAFHGVVAFGDDARTSYERMIELVTRAEDYLKAHGAWAPSNTTPTLATADRKMLEPLHAAINAAAGAPLHMHIDSDARCLAFAQRADLAEISQQGPATPQHAVYTKRVPMIAHDVQAFAAEYRRYLDTHLGTAASARIDAAPRIVLDPQFGLCAFGKTAHDALVAVQMYRHDIAIITRASAHGRYRAAPPAAIAQAEFEYGGFSTPSA